MRPEPGLPEYLGFQSLISGAHLLRSPRDERFQVAVTFSANAEIKGLVEHELLAVVKKIEERVKSAPSEEVYQLNLDLFPWSLSPDKAPTKFI